MVKGRYQVGKGLFLGPFLFALSRVAFHAEAAEKIGTLNATVKLCELCGSPICDLCVKREV